MVDWDPKEAGYAEGYDHLAILALAVEAVKEQQRTIEDLRDQVRILQQEVKRLDPTQLLRFGHPQNHLYAISRKQQRAGTFYIGTSSDGGKT